MISLALAALLWVAIHIGIAGTRVRDAIAGRLGDGGFRGVFSLLSVGCIAWLCLAYDRAPFRPLWYPPGWLLWLLAVLMLAASILFAGSVMTRNPTAIGGEGAEPRGMALITRHPMLWSFAIWGFVHVVGNGDLASVLFFGAFLVTALAGMPSIDAKLAARNPASWARLAAQTSLMPGGRGWPLARVGAAPFVAGAVLWAALFLLHPYVIGVPAVR